MLRLVRFLVVALLLGIFTLSACSEKESLAEVNDVGSELGRFFTEREREGFSGVVLLSRGGERLLFEPYGTAGCAGEPLSEDHVFLIGSIVKVFTKAASYSLVADGKLKFGDPISRYLDSVPPDKESITVGMLVAHTSGFDDTIGENGEPVPYSPDWDYLPVTRAQIIDRGLRSALVFEPGADRRYSNLGYSLLAAVIERAADEPYESYVRRKVLEPLGMAHTGYVMPDWSTSEMAHGCLDGELWKSPNTADKWMNDGPSWNLRGNGGMLGTAGDVAMWLEGLHRADFLPAPVMTELIEDMTGQSRTFSEKATAFAGGNGIVNAYYIWLVDSDIRLIMFSNHSEHQVESYLDDIFPLLKKLQGTPANDGQDLARPTHRHFRVPG